MAFSRELGITQLNIAPRAHIRYDEKDCDHLQRKVTVKMWLEK